MVFTHQLEGVPTMYIKLGRNAFELEAGTRAVYLKLWGRDWFFSRG